MYQRKGYWFSPEERIAIVREFEKGGMSLTQIQAKYGIKGHSTVCKWRQNLQNSKKSSTFAAEIKPQVADEVPMKKRSAEELEAENKKLSKDLEWAELQIKALNTLIDIAESQGIQIRKKSGAKQ
jgi:transposase-like protein